MRLSLNHKILGANLIVAIVLLSLSFWLDWPQWAKIVIFCHLGCTVIAFLGPAIDTGAKTLYSALIRRG